MDEEKDNQRQNQIECVVRPTRKRSAPYYNPVHAKYHNKKILNYKTVRRNHNVELLVTAFNGLKKAQARSALILADDELEKASFLVGMTLCYNRILIASHPSRVKATETLYQHNFFANIDLNRLKDVIFGCDGADLSFSDHSTVTAKSQNEENWANSDESTDEPFRPGKVGVSIKKIAGNYKANILF